MSYRELIFTVPAEIAEPLGDALLEVGALSVTMKIHFMASQGFHLKFKPGIALQ
jgi:hypothetical protein